MFEPVVAVGQIVVVEMLRIYKQESYLGSISAHLSPGFAFNGTNTRWRKVPS